MEQNEKLALGIRFRRPKAVDVNFEVFAAVTMKNFVF
jgi:hypothetical protein